MHMVSKQLARAEGRVACGTCTHGFCGRSNECKSHALEEGAARHERKQRAHQSLGRMTHDKASDVCEVRFQTQTNIVGASECPRVNLVGGMQILATTLTGKSGIRDGELRRVVNDAEVRECCSELQIA